MCDYHVLAKSFQSFYSTFVKHPYCTKKPSCFFLGYFLVLFQQVKQVILNTVGGIIMALYGPDK